MVNHFGVTEVVISTTLEGPDWTRLDYRTMKPTQLEDPGHRGVLRFSPELVAGRGLLGPCSGKHQPERAGKKGGGGGAGE